MKAYLPIVLALLLAAGCVTRPKAPQLGGIYSRAAMHQDPVRNPVIVIPGILGSKLVDDRTGQIVWGAFADDYADPETPAGARLIALPMARGETLANLRDTVRSDGSLDRLKVSLLGLPIELNAYLQILGALGVGGYRDLTLGELGVVDYGDDHYTCFQFDYDWRRDNVENAQRLARFIQEKRVYVQGEIEKRFGVKDHDVKFDIVAHSMGGLITRYYLRYGDAELPEDGDLPITWAGAEHVDRAILVGTPNAGAAQALLQLVNGVRFAPFLPEYNAVTLGTMPSIYQLLPRTRHRAVVAENHANVDVYDVDVWTRYGWGLAAPWRDEQIAQLLPEVTDPAARHAIALDTLTKNLKRAKAFHEALDRDAAPPDGLRLHLFAGDAEDTPAIVTVQDDGSVKVTQEAPGDGTVLRSSTLMDERVGGVWKPRLVSPIEWSSVHFIFRNHLGLTQDESFTDNVLYLLLEAPDPKPRED